MSNRPTPPDSESALLQAIAQEFAGLSRQLQAIARHIEAQHAQLGLQSIQAVAEQCGVQPSAVVRFAKHFGFDGFSAMQRLFREGLAARVAPAHSYQARIRQAMGAGTRTHSSADIAQALVGGSLAGLQELQASLDADALERAVALLAAADTLWLMASRRAYPVSAYLAYALQHTDKRIQHITALGSMQDGQLRGLRAQDVLLAVSFAPYAQETQHIVRQAHAKGAQVVLITDSQLGPLQACASVLLVAQETSVFGFRTLTCAMALAQSLFLALAYRLELQYPPGPTVPPTL